MYRRLKTRGGLLDATPSLMARAVAAHMLKAADPDGRIHLGGRTDDMKELARRLRQLLGGATRSEMRMMPRILESILGAGAWSWDGGDLVASTMVMAPPKRRRGSPEPALNEHSTDTEQALNEHSTGTQRVLNEHSTGTIQPPYPTESLGNPKYKQNITEQKITQQNREVASWVRAGKIIEELFIEATGNCWMLTSRHQTDLSQLWAWSEKQAQVKGGDADKVFRAIARRWIDDDWVKDNGYPLGVLAKAPQKYAVPTSQERKDHEAQLKFLKLKKARLYADGQYEASDKIGEQIRSLSH